MENGLSELEGEFKSYIDPIRKNGISIILQLLSKSFNNITFEQLNEFTHFEDF